MKRVEPTDLEFSVQEDFMHLVNELIDETGWTRGQVGSFMIGMGAYLACEETGAAATIKTFRILEPRVREQERRAP